MLHTRGSLCTITANERKRAENTATSVAVSEDTGSLQVCLTATGDLGNNTIVVGVTTQAGTATGNKLLCVNVCVHDVMQQEKTFITSLKIHIYSSMKLTRLIAALMWSLMMTTFLKVLRISL